MWEYTLQHLDQIVGYASAVVIIVWLIACCVEVVRLQPKHNPNDTTQSDQDARLFTQIEEFRNDF